MKTIVFAIQKGGRMALVVVAVDVHAQQLASN
jgi:hypothetical protein